MEHAHMTEFGSKRYLEKLNQSQENGQSSASGAVAPIPTHTQSPFILPLRGALVSEPEEHVTKADQKRPEKKLFLGIRNKFHSKSSTSATSTATTTTTTTVALHPSPTPWPLSGDYVDRRPSLAESTKQRVPFDQLLCALPSELQVEIIAPLPLSDVLNLRLVSRSMHALVSLNESPIVRYHLDHHVPAYAKRLYPLSGTTAPTFHHLCGIWHRLHVAAKMSDLICGWAFKELFLATTPEKKREYAPQRERMRRRLIPPLFTIFHFFETYRRLHLKYLTENNGIGLQQTPYTINPIEAEIMSMYDDRTLLRAHEIFPLVMASFCRRLRPPSYVGRVERSLRGYIKERPPDEMHVAILCVGGLRQAERIWEVKGYNTRLGEVDNWYSSVTREPVEQRAPEPKKRRGMLGGLKRKKSSFAIGKASSNDDSTAAVRPANEPDSQAGYAEAIHNFIFNTSLAAGMPMAAPTKEQAKLLLSDLPVLQKIWLETAESLILDRKIVERPSEIRRNANVLTDLIRADGMEEEDQWLYGTTAPDSVRPVNLEAIEEDALE